MVLPCMMFKGLTMRLNPDSGDAADSAGQAPATAQGRTLASSRKAWWREMRWQAGRSYRRHKVIAFCLIIVASEAAVATIVGDTPKLILLYNKII